MEHYLLKQLNVTHWKQNFIDLMDHSPNIPIEQMGSPATGSRFPSGSSQSLLSTLQGIAKPFTRQAVFRCEHSCRKTVRQPPEAEWSS